ncbi:NAD-dependent epimerase/dehydratase family protein [Vagococcus fluvialis]|uniref:NAD-dependent epimerase/dehydratase family protein n=1 Tax=Vagococcus fluvialis TaxID=2738 RepID=UPI001A8C615C|nr:NAD-dependent epimerase/dehydratase family protein [Vagococcus fluvialis]MBO0437905.1 NAD-dependent epimerase/dehydratase family protein [Vagococcus fluvialis]
MKRILVTGENSYIGTSFVTYMEQFKDEYEVETLSVRGDEWREKDFSIYDVVFHVAGIAHQKETKKNRQQYFDVNFELTKSIAKKAKKDGVKQFVFLSSMSVYGIKEGKITKKTPLKPTNAYGESKLKAELFLCEIKDDNFCVLIVRPPMVYGKYCKGNYSTMSKMIKRTIIFPRVSNKRSMIFIDNLSFCIIKSIECEMDGIVCPQNNTLVCTSDLANEIRRIQKKKMYMSKIWGILIEVFMFIPIIKKIFGNLYYEFYDFEKVPIDFEESIMNSEEMK